VTEAQWLIIFMHLLTAWLGQDFWSETMIFGFQAADLVTVPAYVHLPSGGGNASQKQQSLRKPSPGLHLK
jgi:hypothetical protein